MQKIKIALLSGGISGERKVSLKTGDEIYEALDKNKYEIFRYDPKTDLKNFCNSLFSKKFDLVFPALHGPFGEDGKIQGMLDIFGIRYVFSGVCASALAMDKYKTKIIAKNAGLNISPCVILDKNNQYNIDEIINKLLFPIVVKPNELGSSVGMSIVKNKRELKDGIKTAFNNCDKIMLEKFIKGREFSVAVIGNNRTVKSMPVIEIIPKASSWFNYDAKYKIGGSDEICPAKISDKIKDDLQNLSIKIFQDIGCKDLARVDFILEEKKNKIYFLEINTIPGMTKTSLVPQTAKADGIEFNELLDKLISFNLD